jgi:hypothetical protein
LRYTKEVVKRFLGHLVIEPDEDSNLATARLVEDAIT